MRDVALSGVRRGASAARCFTFGYSLRPPWANRSNSNTLNHLLDHLKAIHFDLKRPMRGCGAWWFRTYVAHSEVGPRLRGLLLAGRQGLVIIGGPATPGTLTRNPTAHVATRLSLLSKSHDCVQVVPHSSTRPPWAGSDSGREGGRILFGLQGERLWPSTNAVFASCRMALQCSRRVEIATAAYPAVPESRVLSECRYSIPIRFLIG